jgi:hypothetical protein
MVTGHCACHRSPGSGAPSGTRRWSGQRCGRRPRRRRRRVKVASQKSTMPDGLRSGKAEGSSPAEREGRLDLLRPALGRGPRPAPRCGGAGHRRADVRGSRPSRGEAHGSIGRSPGGNARCSQRTRRRTKALRPRRPGRAQHPRALLVSAERMSRLPACNGERAPAAVNRAGRSTNAQGVADDPDSSGTEATTGVRPGRSG